MAGWGLGPIKAWEGIKIGCDITGGMISTEILNVFMMQ